MAETLEVTLSPEEIDQLTETLGIGLGQAAAVFNTITDSHVRIRPPSVRVGTRKDLPQLLSRLIGTELATVNLGFRGGITGSANLIFPEDAAAKLVEIVCGVEAGSGQLDSMRAGALAEVGNIVLNGIMGAISNVLSEHLTYSVPEFLEDSLEHMFDRDDLNASDVVLVADGRLEVERLHVVGDIVLVFELDSFQTLSAGLRAAYAGA